MEWEVKIVRAKKPMDIHHVSHLLADIILRGLNKEPDVCGTSQEPRQHAMNTEGAEPRRSLR